MQKITNRKIAQLIAILLAVAIFISSVGKGFVAFQYYMLGMLLIPYIVFLLFIKKDGTTRIQIRHETTAQPFLNEIILLLKIVLATISLCFLIKIMPAILSTKTHR